jgi:hypothetical protein
MKPHDKIPSSTCVSKLDDFVMLVSLVDILLIKEHMAPLAAGNTIMKFRIRPDCQSPILTYPDS